ncbi:MAG: YciI family protein [Pseudomonadota bacterium]|nr:YciI family protein [Pseudomonadota bacterium]
MYVAVLITRPEKASLRETFKPAHDAYWDTRMDKIRLAGPMLSDDGSTRIGQIIILNVADRAAASDIVMNDPFVTNGLFGDITINRYRISVEGGVAL